jgi:hypothetical protein
MIGAAGNAVTSLRAVVSYAVGPSVPAPSAQRPAANPKIAVAVNIHCVVIRINEALCSIG